MQRSLIANIILFQMGWFACLLLPLTFTVVVVLAILLCHFFFIVHPQDRFSESLLLVKVLGIGAVIECAYLYSGVLVKTQGFLLPPLWLLFLWLLFATTLRYGLYWLRNKPLWAALSAAVAAPMSYYAGAKLSTTMALGDSVLVSLAVVAVSWGIVFPLIMSYMVTEKQS